jgi:hypothetical protein
MGNSLLPFMLGITKCGSDLRLPHPDPGPYQMHYLRQPYRSKCPCSFYKSPFLLALPHKCSIFYTSQSRDNMMTPVVLLLATLSAPVATLVSRADDTCSIIPQCPDEDGCTTTTANGAKFQLHCSTDFSGPSIATTQVRSTIEYFTYS